MLSEKVADRNEAIGASCNGPGGAGVTGGVPELLGTLSIFCFALAIRISSDLCLLAEVLTRTITQLKYISTPEFSSPDFAYLGPSIAALKK